MMLGFTFLWLLTALVLSPFNLGIINRTKAIAAGRTGPPLLQPYFDLLRLLKKGAVFSRTTSYIFQVTPAIVLATSLFALIFIPCGSIPALFSFRGDFLFVFYLLALGRFFLVVGALDTGSAFEGMGASREVFFAALGELALFIVLCALVMLSKGSSLTEVFVNHFFHSGSSYVLSLLLLAPAFFFVILAENSRIPVDDPTTHLELTMIHEVMILDNSGPDLGLLEYASALKLWLLSALLSQLLMPINTHVPGLNYALVVLGIFGIAIAIGIVESTIARLRLPRIPQALAGACAFGALGIIILGG